MLGISLGIPDNARRWRDPLLPIATAYFGGIEPYHYWDFTTDRALFAGVEVGGTGNTPNMAIAGNGPNSKYIKNAAGVLLPTTAGDIRRSDRGLLVETARTNICLWSDDFTNAAWVKTNVTAALDQTSVNGTPNAASTLTATAANGTVLQTITSASATHSGGIWIRRLVGTGNIDITINGGTTWTTRAITDTLTRIEAPAATVLNPVFGIRIATSGDSVAVQFAQLESDVSLSSPITTQGVAVARAGERVFVSSIGVNWPLTMFVEYERAENLASTQNTLQLDNGTATDRAFLHVTNVDARSFQVVTANVSQGTIASGTSVLEATEKMAARVATNDIMMAAGGTLSSADTSVTLPPTPTGLRFGSTAGGSGSFMYIKRAAIFTTPLTNAQLQAITT